MLCKMTTAHWAPRAIKAEEKSAEWRASTSFTSVVCHLSLTSLSVLFILSKISTMSKLLILSIFVLAAFMTLGAAENPCADIYESSAARYHLNPRSTRKGALKDDLFKCYNLVKFPFSGFSFCKAGCLVAANLCIDACATVAEACGPACVAAGAACIKAC